MTRSYWCLLRYSRKDEAVARWRADASEGFRLPKTLIGKPGCDELVPRLIHPVFRDRAELPASAELGATLKQALEASRVLVVLCSPESAKSRWVEESSSFLQTQRAGGSAPRRHCSRQTARRYVGRRMLPRRVAFFGAW